MGSLGWVLCEVSNHAQAGLEQDIDLRHVGYIITLTLSKLTVSLIDFNYFFSGYLSDAYWGSWLFVTHDITVCLPFFFEQ
jgi:hypothetical protein